MRRLDREDYFGWRVDAVRGCMVIQISVGKKGRNASKSRRLARKIWRDDLPLITVPLSKSLFAPERNLSVTVPGVLGFHVMEVGWPAVREKPLGLLKALGPSCC